MEEVKTRSKKFCHFCKTRTEPRYFDMQSLRRHLSDRGRIVPKMRTGTCAKHQRIVGREIKRARHLAILPFTIRI
ncbi:30S ribosomal protein S18 [Candidatus Daviesbacteria bacterium RIFOXYD1_FULL_41_10]|uniref:Small ribosomal subunit protein bS18 n=1 Tax=Candidatus Daviesbacteria bacterium RIFOXYD1_FULL_41_10 TaxID=1797801 RepID=A0A1F5N213_9BACT|nr:MAG: 30S ribosomal protein S18 [Candidatus Daviesbacteria bacterium RIFOXYD1_FULL_41_10]